jgi:hypothetical protein
MRRVTYRLAATAFVFLGLWFVLGFLVLSSSIPGALGIAPRLFVVWLLLLFLIMGVAGGLLAAAAYNGLFPPDRPRLRRGRRAQAPAARRPGRGSISIVEREISSTGAGRHGG